MILVLEYINLISLDITEVYQPCIINESYRIDVKNIAAYTIPYFFSI